MKKKRSNSTMNKKSRVRQRKKARMAGNQKKAYNGSPSEAHKKRFPDYGQKLAIAMQKIAKERRLQAEINAEIAQEEVKS